MGKPAKPIRLMVSLLILKYLGNLCEENLVGQWSENIYFQYFSGEQIFQPKIPCVPTALIAFRQRIGEAGVELILQESIRINKDQDNNSNGTIVSSKVSILIDQDTGVIKGAINFTQTLHNSKTIPEVLEQYERLNDSLPKEV